MRIAWAGAGLRRGAVFIPAWWSANATRAFSHGAELSLTVPIGAVKQLISHPHRFMSSISFGSVLNVFGVTAELSVRTKGRVQPELLAVLPTRSRLFAWPTDTVTIAPDISQAKARCSAFRPPCGGPHAWKHRGAECGHCGGVCLTSSKESVSGIAK